MGRGRYSSSYNFFPGTTSLGESYGIRCAISPPKGTATGRKKQPVTAKLPESLNITPASIGMGRRSRRKRH